MFSRTFYHLCICTCGLTTRFTRKNVKFIIWMACKQCRQQITCYFHLNHNIVVKPRPISINQNCTLLSHLSNDDNLLFKWNFNEVCKCNIHKAVVNSKWNDFQFWWFNLLKWNPNDFSRTRPLFRKLFIIHNWIPPSPPKTISKKKNSQKNSLSYP